MNLACEVGKIDIEGRTALLFRNPESGLSGHSFQIVIAHLGVGQRACLARVLLGFDNDSPRIAIVRKRL